MSRFKWLKLGKKTDPELPLEPPMWFGNRSNGEYFREATRRDRLTRKLILEKADENARRLGIDRRQFLASAMGMATSIWAIKYVSGCSSDETGATPAEKQANLCPLPETMLDENMACSQLSGDEFIFDVQTHWFSRDDMAKNPGYLTIMGWAFDLATEQNYIRWMFLESDTHVAALTDWPGVTCREGVEVCGIPLSNESIVASRDKINQLAANTRRVVNHVQLNVPSIESGGDVQFELDVMESMCPSGVAAWKLYPGFHRFKLTEPNGRAVIEKGLSLGVRQFCVHKGLQIGGFFDPVYNYPDDIGVVAAEYPNANFVIYHSAICSLSPAIRAANPTYNDCVPGVTDEGPYDPNNPNGVNALIKSLADNGIGPEPGQKPNTNVYGEIGSAINEVMNDPIATAHFFGKLMKYLGPDHVVWGTDCVVYTSPQRFIDWFRSPTTTIPEAMQAEFGYPPLDATNKAKIFGLNAAKLYGIDANEARCAVQQTALYKMKQQLDHELGPRRWAFETPLGPRSREEYVQHVRLCRALGRPG